MRLRDGIASTKMNSLQDTGKFQQQWDRHRALTLSSRLQILEISYITLNKKLKIFLCLVPVSLKCTIQVSIFSPIIRKKYIHTIANPQFYMCVIQFLVLSCKQTTITIQCILQQSYTYSKLWLAFWNWYKKNHLFLVLKLCPLCMDYWNSYSIALHLQHSCFYIHKSIMFYVNRRYTL